MTVHTGRHFLQIPGPTNVPDRVLRAMDMPVIGAYSPWALVMGGAGDAALDRYADFDCADFQCDEYKDGWQLVVAWYKRTDLSDVAKIVSVEFKETFPIETLRIQVKTPLLLTETEEQFDVLATVSGGGVSGQAGAIRLGIARALCEFNIEHRSRLKKDGLLTRDARAKERKKYGMAGARKRFQFSKR